jgi:UDPglucose 6-dehydrogenase
VNVAQHQRIVNKLRAATGGSLAGRVVAVWGLTFKAETDDLRDSPAMTIARAVREQGAIVRAFDPVASEKAQALDPDLDVYPDAYDAADGADVVALLTEWDEFRWLDFDRVRDNMPQPSIVDARNVLDPAAMRRLGFAYVGVGRR